MDKGGINMKRPHYLFAVCMAVIMVSLFYGCSGTTPGSPGSSDSSQSSSTTTPSEDPSGSSSESSSEDSSGSSSGETAEEPVIPPGMPTTGLNVVYHTQAEIRSYLKNNGADFYDPVQYAVDPVIPDTLGRLSQDTKDSALAILNNFRFIAGLTSVTWDDTLEDQQQAGCMINAMNGDIDHYPVQPSGLSDELYALGCLGTSTSNLGAGYGTLNLSILGYMSDVGISSLGHRRWCLNPSMESVCMGAVSNSNTRYRHFYSMYSFDRSLSAGVKTVAWPAQNTPIEYFDSRESFDSGAFWSLSLGYPINKESVQVVVTKKGGPTWKFSSDTSNGSFDVNNGNYGQQGCIMFKPPVTSYRDGDQFTVTVILEEEQAIQYTVTFFDL